MILLILNALLCGISLVMMTEIMTMFRKWEKKGRTPCSPLCSINSNNKHIMYKAVTSFVGLIVTSVMFAIVVDILLFLTTGSFLFNVATHFALFLGSMGAHIVVATIHILYKRDLMIFDIKK